ncbi:MAG: hypothetical protein R2911_23075 [Caldilineaceae bacterium]
MQHMHFFVRDAAPLLAALVIAIYVAYRLVILIRQKRQLTFDFFTVTSLVTAQALLLLADAITLTVDNVTGQHNLFWFLGYALVTFTSFLYGFMMCSNTAFKPSRMVLQYLWVGLLAVESLMLLIFVFHLVHTPMWRPYTPRAVTEVLFALGLLGYALMVATMGLATVVTAMQMHVVRSASPTRGSYRP